MKNYKINTEEPNIDYIHDFSVWVRTGFNPLDDINRF